MSKFWLYCSLNPSIHSPKKTLTPTLPYPRCPTQLLASQPLAYHPVKSPFSFPSHGEASLLNTLTPLNKRKNPLKHCNSPRCSQRPCFLFDGNTISPGQGQDGWPNLWMPSFFPQATDPQHTVNKMALIPTHYELCTPVNRSRLDPWLRARGRWSEFGFDPPLKRCVTESKSASTWSSLTIHLTLPTL